MYRQRPRRLRTLPLTFMGVSARYILVVPSLVSGRHGRRLGYGGGFYGRTLALRPGRPAIGRAYPSQEVDAVPVGPYDIALDAVATERGVIRCGDG